MVELRKWINNFIISTRSTVAIQINVYYFHCLRETHIYVQTKRKIWKIIYVLNKNRINWNYTAGSLGLFRHSWVALPSANTCMCSHTSIVSWLTAGRRYWLMRVKSSNCVKTGKSAFFFIGIIIVLVFCYTCSHWQLWMYLQLLRHSNMCSLCFHSAFLSLTSQKNEIAELIFNHNAEI